MSKQHLDGEPGHGLSSSVCAAPHPPAGTFSPYSDGEKGFAAMLALVLQRWRLTKALIMAFFSPSLYGEKCPAGQ
ncbi:hypothetical protein FJ960_28790 [Mesorhizobium sp. B2-3-11]|nr:hypothetical protein FJ960_28790 [Mesorhizobium sp. B2-3-11]